jgi:hypothetical protein
MSSLVKQAEDAILSSNLDFYNSLIAQAESISDNHIKDHVRNMAAQNIAVIESYMAFIKPHPYCFLNY